MKSSSPTLEGFRLMLRRPSFGLAEIAWRWSFGLASCLLLAFSFFEYLKTLAVTRGDLLLLRSRQPVLISQAIAHIFGGSGFRVVQTIIILATCLAIGWIVVASLARAATIKALLGYFSEPENSPAVSRQPATSRLHSLFGLNVFRVAATLAATIGCLAALLLGGAVSPAGNPAPGSAFLVFLSVVLMVWLVWSVMNWFLSLAAVFVIAEGQDTFCAIGSAAVLCRNRAGSVFAAGTWFGLAHITAFVIATSVVAFPLGLAGVLPTGIVLGGVILVTLLYFAIADYLYMGRLAAYVAILELPQTPLVSDKPASGLPPGDQRVVTGTPASNAVDQDELILSDSPA
jgi:hypothetical protein